jgi:hypothetical protein
MIAVRVTWGRGEGVSELYRDYRRVAVVKWRLSTLSLFSSFVSYDDV